MLGNYRVALRLLASSVVLSRIQVLRSSLLAEEVTQKFLKLQVWTLIDSCRFLALLTFLPWRWKLSIAPKRRLTFSGFLSVIFYGVKFFSTVDRTNLPLVSASLSLSSPDPWSVVVSVGLNVEFAHNNETRFLIAWALVLQHLMVWEEFSVNGDVPTHALRVSLRIHEAVIGKCACVGRISNGYSPDSVV
jgi:hypothetical protein